MKSKSTPAKNLSLNKIESFTHDLIQIGKFELPVSRSYRHEVEKVLNL